MSNNFDLHEIAISLSVLGALTFLQFIWTFLHPGDPIIILYLLRRKLRKAIEETISQTEKQITDCYGSMNQIHINDLSLQLNLIKVFERIDPRTIAMNVVAPVDCYFTVSFTRPNFFDLSFVFLGFRRRILSGDLTFDNFVYTTATVAPSRAALLLKDERFRSFVVDVFRAGYSAVWITQNELVIQISTKSKINKHTLKLISFSSLQIFFPKLAAAAKDITEQSKIDILDTARFRNLNNSPQGTSESNIPKIFQ